MPPPPYYTEQSLAEYAHQELGEMARRLDWEVAHGSYTEIVNNVLLGLGISALPSWNSSLQLQQLRVFTVYQSWKQVVKNLASKYQFGADFQSFNRQQMQQMAMASLALAEADCLALGLPTAGGSNPWEVGIEPVDYVHDPYAYHPPSYSAYPYDYAINPTVPH